MITRKNYADCAEHIKKTRCSQMFPTAFWSLLALKRTLPQLHYGINQEQHLQNVLYVILSGWHTKWSLASMFHKVSASFCVCVFVFKALFSFCLKQEILSISKSKYLTIKVKTDLTTLNHCIWMVLTGKRLLSSVKRMLCPSFSVKFTDTICCKLGDYELLSIKTVLEKA